MGNKPPKQQGGATDEWMKKELAITVANKEYKSALSRESIRSNSSHDGATVSNSAQSSDAYPTITIGYCIPGTTTTVTFLVLSDTHNQHRQLPLPPQGADVLLHCGDWSNWKTSKKNTEDFNQWLGSLDANLYKRKIVVGGNHELCCSKLPIQQVRSQLITNAEYYSTGDQTITHESGLKLFLSPSTLSRNLTYRANAFAKHSDELKEEFNQCPTDIDVLVTHSPPYGILDRHKKGHRMGSMALWDTVRRVLPTVHVFGHCHDNGGAETRSILPQGTSWGCPTCTFQNVSEHLACGACGTERVPTNVTFINASNKLNVQPFLLTFHMKHGTINHEDARGEKKDGEDDADGDEKDGVKGGKMGTGTGTGTAAAGDETGQSQRLSALRVSAF